MAIFRCRMKVLILLSSLAALDVCSGTNMLRDRFYGSLANSVPCCKSFKEMDFAPLENGLLEFEVRTTDPTFEFDTGKSFFRAFALPPRTQTSRVTISTFSNELAGGWFQPDLLILDNAKKVTKRIAAPLVGQPMERKPFQPGVFRYEFELPADNDRYAFLIVRTTKDLLAAHTPVAESVTMVAGNVLVPLRNVAKVAHWPAGKLSLELR